MSVPTPSPPKFIDLARLDATRAAMERYGGQFAKAISKAVLEVDDGLHFAHALLDLHRVCDPENATKLIRAFPTLWVVLDDSEASRRQVLIDCLEPYFLKYQEMARPIPNVGPDFY